MLKVFTLVVVISFSIDKLAYYTLNAISDRVYTGQGIGKLNHFLKLKDSLDIIIMGSSRANHTIDASNLGNRAFNMGLDGRHIAYTNALVQLLPPDRPQTIILQVDPAGAVASSYDGNDIRALATYYNRLSTVREKIDALQQQNVFQHVYWCIAYNGILMGVLKNFIKPNYDYRQYDGYDPIYPTPEQQKILAGIISGNVQKKCNEMPVLNLVYDKLLSEISDWCKANNKVLIAYASPEYNDVCKADDAVLEKAMIQKGIRFYNYTDFFRGQNELSYWKDETHLSDKAAQLFTTAVQKTWFPDQY